MLQINLSEMQALSKTLRKQFSDNPVVWLKDLASFLNVKLNPTTVVDAAYRQEGGHNAPLEFMPLPIREVSRNDFRNYFKRIIIRERPIIIREA